jgi:2,4-dienoyl-CoA reductase-like NADH-dependent reductase (Old Yellow Enzyme family)
MAHLFSPLALHELNLRNRIVMSPMCMYCANSDGQATDWHLAHLASRAAGGVGLIVTGATAVEARGRISINDLGLWEDAQIAPLARLVRACREQGAAMCIQLAHAGRKAWKMLRGSGPDVPVAPSAVPHSADWVTPRALGLYEIEGIVAAFGAAAQRAELAGFDAIEIHAGHGYLLHQFLSPLSNQRGDEYGGGLENRVRLLLRVIDSVRRAWPESKLLLVRVSATDWAEGGLTLADVIKVAGWLRAQGVDVIDCSSGGISPAAPPEIGPGYQVPFAEAIRRETKILTIAVGLITSPELADSIVRNGQADLVALGRELLRNPYWALEAGRALGQEVAWPHQYQRAKLS